MSSFRSHENHKKRLKNVPLTHLLNPFLGYITSWCLYDASHVSLLDPFFGVSINEFLTDVQGDDLVYGICEAIDGEKDPHCLMLTFHIVELVAKLFPDPTGTLASSSSDLFEFLGCYFPIHFTHVSSMHLVSSFPFLISWLSSSCIRLIIVSVLLSHFGGGKMMNHYCRTKQRLFICLFIFNMYY